MFAWLAFDCEVCNSRKIRELKQTATATTTGNQHGAKGFSNQTDSGGITDLGIRFICVPSPREGNDLMANHDGSRDVYNFRNILEIRTEFSVWVQRGRPKDYLLALYFFHNRRKSSKSVHDRVSYNYLTCNVRAS